MGGPLILEKCHIPHEVSMRSSTSLRTCNLEAHKSKPAKGVIQQTAAASSPAMTEIILEMATAAMPLTNHGNHEDNNHHHYSLDQWHKAVI